MNKTAEVLAAIMRERDISQTQLAKAVGVSPQAVQQWCSGKTSPRGNSLAKLADYLKIAPAVIQYGPSEAIERTTSSVVETEDGFIAIPQFSASGSCGGGYDNETPSLRALVGMVRVTRAWLLAKAPSLNWKRLEVITARGDSMSPTIKNLDFVFVDRSFSRIEDDGIYVLTFADTTYIKRVQKQVNGSLLLISDNPRYPSMLIEGPDLERVTVEGRCVINCSAIDLM